MATQAEKEKWQIIQRHVGAGIDGIPRNETATKVLDYLRKIETLCPKPGTAEPIPAPPVDLSPIPPNRVVSFPVQTEANAIRIFGQPGTGSTPLKLPYEMRISWDLKKTINQFYCHALVHDSLLGIFEDTLNHYGIERIKKLGLDRWGGCINVRKVTGGTAWSQHAFGTAVDMFPEENQYKWGKDKALFAKPEYNAWWDIVEAHGWHSLGRRANYDWMHFQAMPFK